MTECVANAIMTISGKFSPMMITISSALSGAAYSVVSTNVSYPISKLPRSFAWCTARRSRMTLIWKKGARLVRFLLIQIWHPFQKSVVVGKWQKTSTWMRSCGLQSRLENRRTWSAKVDLEKQHSSVWSLSDMVWSGLVWLLLGFCEPRGWMEDHSRLKD